MTDEDERAGVDGKSWEAFGARLGWTLYGWTFGDRATFLVGDGREHVQISKGVRRAMEVAMGGDWRPIETAPKDGTRIIVCDAAGWVGEVDWFHSWYNDTTQPGWMIANCDEEYGHYVEATYWMPLPAPQGGKS